MDERSYSTEAVVLARRNLGEADRLLTIFSKHYGKLRVLAKGVRKVTSRKRGSLELFNQVKIMLARGKNLDIITDSEVKESFNSWRKDLAKVGVAYHLCEVVERLTAERQEHREVFELLSSSLSLLSEVDYWQLDPFIKSFKARVLEELGFLERGKPEPKNLDLFIEDLVNGNLCSKKFLSRISRYDSG